MRRRLLLGVLALSLLTGACGYFNAYYNAQRRFNEGERARRRGERGAAQSAYSDAVNKAAVSYRKYPSGRWADDALFLIGRARFAMGEYGAARAALGSVLEQSRDRELRTGAALYLGASLFHLGFPDSAVAVLEPALADVKGGSELQRFGRLWRGRAALALHDPSGWEDLEVVAAQGGVLGIDAGFEMAAHALVQPDSARMVRALSLLLANREGEARLDSIFRLVERAGKQWRPAALLPAFPPHAAQRWTAESRARVGLARAGLHAAAGDTGRAVSEAIAAAGLSTGLRSGEAREAAALWSLPQVQGVEELPRIRALLLPGIAQPGPLQQIRRLRKLDVLLERARDGQTAGLFAAGEFARDSLHAPRLARQLFLAYADVAADAVWAPKALLAALALSDGTGRDSLTSRIRQYPDNPYVASLSGGGDAAGYAAAEERLGRSIAALRTDAEAAALTGDVRVSRAVAVIDSLRTSARADTLRLRCGTLLDSLALGGIRADSVRVACLRGDSAHVTRYLALDTLALRDTAAARKRRTTGGDTLQTP